MRRLIHWLGDPQPALFPYDQVVGEFQRTGKHFVAEELLKSLARARELLKERPDDAPVRDDGRDRVVLLRFLDTALDKYDGVYDYLTYTALCVLDLPGPDHALRNAEQVYRARDRLVAMLLADAMEFELAASEGRTGLMPEMRPAPGLVAKRYRHALRVARPALARLALDGTLGAGEPALMARQLVATARREATAEERRTLRLSMLPVYVSHDEYLFIRVLQAFETTFVTVASRLRAAIDAADRADAAGAAVCLNAAAGVLSESAPLFSLLATMQVASFRTFRDFTEGASAIQSTNYKLLESLCRAPDPERMESAAYSSTPGIYARIQAGQRTLDDAFRAALDDARYGADDRARLSAAMRGFASALRRWRQTHYRLAVRMLGERPGTGYTEGTPYLKDVRIIPVFRLIDEAAGDEAQ